MSLNLKQIGSTIATFALYTYLVNWQVAALACFGIGWHEYCHILAAKRLGMKTGGFYLVPFMGGVSFVTEAYKTFFQRVFVVLMGPVGGSLPGLLLTAAFYLTGSKHVWMAAAAEWLILVNLFNLLPLSFLDGGQITESITYSINETLGLVCLALGTLIAIVVIFKLNIFISIMILFMGVPQVIAAYNDWKYNREGKTWLLSDAYLNRPKLLSKREIVITTSLYAAAALVLGGIYYALYNAPGVTIMYFVTHK